MLVADQAGDIDSFERHLWRTVFVFHEVHGHHDHPGNPEEDDVKAGDQHVSGVEGFQPFSDFRPAQGAKGPQCRAEPGIQNIVVLAEFQVGGQVVLLANFVFAAAHVDVALGVVPGRNAVAPPELAGNTPVLDIAHPGEVHILVLFGHELDTPVLHSFNGRLGQSLGVSEPLVGQHRLDDQAGAVATGYAQHVVFHFINQAFGVHVCNDLLAGFFTGEPGVGGGKAAIFVCVLGAIRIDHFRHITDAGILGHDVDHHQVVAFAHGVVVEVMGRGDLNAAAAFFRIGVGVGNDGNAAAYQRQVDELAYQVLVTLIVRVHRHGSVTQHGFWAGGGHHQIVVAILRFLAVGQRVTQVPEKALFFLVLHFQIGDRGMKLRIPVDQTLAAIDQAFVVQADEHFLHGFVEAVVHGEALVVPVHGIAQAAHLTGDGAAGVFFPVPDPFDEFFPAQVVAGLVFFRSQFAFNHHLGCDTGVVAAYLPEGVTALHAFEAGERVHDGVLERVAHVEAAGNIGWRDGDAERFAFAGGTEVPFGFPVFVPLALDVFWLVGFFHGFLLVTVWLIHKGNSRRLIIHAHLGCGEPWGAGAWG